MLKTNIPTILLLHLSIVIAGFTGVFGRLISLEAPFLTFYRTLMAAMIIFLTLCLIKKDNILQFKDKFKAAGVGALLFVHWVLFYLSIKLSNISIGVICLAAMGFYTAVLEPLFLRRRFRLTEILLSFLALTGLLLIFHFDARYRAGIAIGLLSSLIASLFTIANKKVSCLGEPKEILGFEMYGAAAAALITVPLWAVILDKPLFAMSIKDGVYLLLLSSICTIGLYFLQLKILKAVSAFTVNLSYNLEPVYTIIMAMLLFKEYEYLGLSFVLGLIIIAGSVILQNLRVIREQRSL